MENQIEKLGEESKTYLQKALSVQIKSQEQYDNACAFLRGVKALEKSVKDSFDPIVQKAHSAWKEAIAQRDKYLAPLAESEKIIKLRVSEYVSECQRKERAEQERLRLEAEEKARKEKERLEKKAEKLEEKGDDWKAEEVREQALAVEAVVRQADPQMFKAQGVSQRKSWKARVVNFALLSDDYKLPNNQMLDAIARATKGNKEIPGVEFYEECSVAVR